MRALLRGGSERAPAEKKFEKFEKSSWQTECYVIEYSGASARGAANEKQLRKKFEKLEKSSWQTVEDVIECISCPMNGRKPGGRCSVPCKLNNAKTNKNTLDKLMDLFKFREIELTANEILEYIC